MTVGKIFSGSLYPVQPPVSLKTGTKGPEFKAVIDDKLYCAYSGNINLNNFAESYDPSSKSSTQDKQKNAYDDYFMQGWLLYTSSKA